MTFDIESGTTVGLIGSNGSGKSTLLKTIGGILEPTLGTVRRRGRLAALLELGAGFHPDLTGRENVYLNAAILGLSKEETDKHFDEIVEFSGIPEFIDTQVKFYSSGMYVRLAFSVAVHVNPDILIIDEVLAVGDEPFQRKCLDRIKKFKSEGKTIVIVSHALEQIAELCDRVIVLDHGETIYDGKPGMGLRILRDGFEKSRVLELTNSNNELEDIKIDSVTIRTVQSKKSAENVKIQVHDQLFIDVKISSSNLCAPIIGIGIESALGQNIFGTNTELLSLRTLAVDKKATIRFELQDLHLGEGRYYIHASVGTIETGELYRIPQAATFEMLGDGQSIGSTYINTKITIE